LCILAYIAFVCSLTTTPSCVADAAKAFRELRVRPALVGAERAARLERSPVRPSAASERPSSPKKRKATYNIDKEFILKDDKVKRNTGMC
jgi:hypothetical protein